MDVGCNDLEASQSGDRFFGTLVAAKDRSAEGQTS